MGRQSPKADCPFLDAILSSGITAHLMHSAEASHIGSLFEENGWSVERYGEADFSFPQHTPIIADREARLEQLSGD